MSHSCPSLTVASANSNILVTETRPKRHRNFHAPLSAISYSGSGNWSDRARPSFKHQNHGEDDNPMKKVCAVLFVLLLAVASFAQDHDDNVVRSKKIAGNITVDRNVGDLQMVAEFEQQVVGVAVSASGRVFVSFPRNGIDTVKKSVMEVINRKAPKPGQTHEREGLVEVRAVAYPNEEINTLNTAAPSTHFLSAQSVYVDSSDTLWVLDVGNLGSGTALISGGAKLVAIDLTTNAVKRTIVFPDSLITKGTS